MMTAVRTCDVDSDWGRGVSTALRVHDARPDGRSRCVCLAVEDHGACWEMTRVLIGWHVACLPVSERAFAIHALHAVLGSSVDEASLR